MFGLSKQKALFTHLETETNKQQTFQTSCHNKSNLIKAEWKDLLALKNNSELIIKDADKGGCLVLMNKPRYKRMIFQHLNDSNTYQKTDEKCDNRVMKKIDELTNWRSYILQTFLFH